jgi:hypothetical protein
VLTSCAGFVEVDDPALIEALHADPEGRTMWVGPPRHDGLLVRAGVSEAKLLALLTRHGARLVSGTQN